MRVSDEHVAQLRKLAWAYNTGRLARIRGVQALYFMVRRLPGATLWCRKTLIPACSRLNFSARFSFLMIFSIRIVNFR